MFVGTSTPTFIRLKSEMPDTKLQKKIYGKVKNRGKKYPVILMRIMKSKGGKIAPVPRKKTELHPKFIGVPQYIGPETDDDEDDIDEENLPQAEITEISVLIIHQKRYKWFSQDEFIPYYR